MRELAGSEHISPQDAALLAQLRSRQALKDECLHTRAESPLRKEAEKLLAMADMAREAAPGPQFSALLGKECRFAESLQAEMLADYEAMPPAIRAGSDARDRLILLGAALHRLTQAAENGISADMLEEAAFLLYSADE